MTSGGAPPPAEHVGVISQSKQPSRSPTPNSGGEFLLQLLQNPPQNKPPPTATPSTSLPLDHHIPHHQHHHHDPAVAALGPSHPFPPWPGSPDFHTPEIRPWSNNHPYPPHLPPHAFPQFPWPLPGFPPPAAATINQFDPRNSHLPANHPAFGDDLHRLGFLHPPAPPAPALAPAGDFGSRPGRRDGHSVENTLRFGSIMFNVGDREGLPNGISSYDSLRRDDRKFLDVQPKIQLSRNSSTEKEVVVVSERSGSSKIQARKLVSEVNSHGSHSHNGNRARHEQGRRAPPAKQENRSGALEHRRPVGPLGKPKGGRQWVALNERQDEELGVEKEECRNSPNRSNHPSSPAHANNDFPLSESRRIQGNVSPQLHLGIQLDHPGPPTGSNLHSVPATDIVESLMHLQAEVVDKRYGLRDRREDKMNTARASGSANVRGNSQEPHMLREQLMDSLMVRDELTNKNAVRHDNGSHVKDFRLDFCRGLQAPGQRMRNHRRDIDCRSDIERLSHSFLSIYESLIPAEEEKAKQKQLLALLEKLVNKEWPGAQLYLYGSCASSFGVSTSDIDICLAIEDADINKPEILLKLAEILESDNLQNVQALTHARVPIVKLMDPLTGISCDICINNVLAVVNTKLLRDYAQIDVRLRQLAFIVKHWAKSRGVNETYQGTLSSYAYVIMCIHFLQRRRPAILPFLQEMEATYVVNVDDIECAFFDKVERLHDFGAQNRESIAQLLWAFFDYWAYRHDYANAVISVRTARIISKRAKDWTRRIGNDRHLICIEDPFEVSHDLGRVVDKHTIKILRAEFERAADIMQHDPNPSVTLFEPYVPR